MCDVAIDYDFSREISKQNIDKLRGRKVKGSLYFLGNITIRIGDQSVSEVDRLYWFLSGVLTTIEDLLKGKSSRVTAGFWESVFYLGFSLEEGKLCVAADERVDSLWGTPEFCELCEISSFIKAIADNCNTALSHLDYMNLSYVDMQIENTLYVELSEKCDNLMTFIGSIRIK